MDHPLCIQTRVIVAVVANPSCVLLLLCDRLRESRDVNCFVTVSELQMHVVTPAPNF